MTTTTTQTELVDRVWEEAFENGELAVIDEAVASDYICHTPSDPAGVRGPEEFKAFVRTSREAFPDLSVTVDDRIVGDDVVVDRYTMRGTHEGDFMGIVPTGNVFETTGIVIHYIEDGKIVKDLAEFDNLDTMAQLGVVEPPGV